MKDYNGIQIKSIKSGRVYAINTCNRTKAFGYYELVLFCSEDSSKTITKRTNTQKELITLIKKYTEGGKFEIVEKKHINFKGIFSK